MSNKWLSTLWDNFRSWQRRDLHIPHQEIQTSFKFNNYSLPSGKRGKLNWFKWKVFMDELPERLRKVKSVEYRLHETFPDPIRVVEDRNSRFALQSEGWGEFIIYIVIYLEDGTEEYGEYKLDLSKPSGDLV
jgi:hypothetical protein